MIAGLKVFGSQELEQQHVEAAQANGFVDFGPWANVLRGRVEAQLEKVEDGEDGDDRYDSDDSVRVYVSVCSIDGMDSCRN